jgi:hypothetical protein
MSNDDVQPTIPKQRPRVEQEMLDHGTEDLSVTSWRIFRVMAEFVAGNELFLKNQPLLW